MAQTEETDNLRRRVAITYYNLKKIKSKVQRKAADIGFVKKVIHLEITPKFARVKGNFASPKDKWRAEKSILEASLRQHYKDMNILIRKMKEEEGKIRDSHSPLFFRFVERRISMELRKERLQSFRTKNKKIDRLKKEKIPKKQDSYRVPIINLSNVTLTDEQTEALRYGMHHSYIDRNKYIKQNLAVEIEALVDSTNGKVRQEDKENYHEFLIKYTNIFSKNVYDTKDYT